VYPRMTASGSGYRSRLHASHNVTGPATTTGPTTMHACRGRFRGPPGSTYGFGRLRLGGIGRSFHWVTPAA
jgi:hypothetical protein